MNSSGSKKNCTLNHRERTALIEKRNRISVARQTELLAISRSSIYYQPIVGEQDIQAMNAIDTIYTARPFYGSRRMRYELKDEYGISIGRHHIRRLMRLMGLEAVYPRKRVNTSISDNSHRKYPYLVGGIIPSYSNQIWGTDITYVRLEKGWAYLTALIDWFSRYVLAWELSPTLETQFCITALQRALAIGTPTFHNSDQGVQFTDRSYTTLLEEQNIQISMDGRGRCMDNIFTERLWRTVKYENVYLKSYQTIDEAREGLIEYFQFYNTKRRHQSLRDRTPAHVFFNR